MHDSFDPLEPVAQMFTQAKAVLTPLEAQLWELEVQRMGAQRLLEFAAFWMRGEVGVSRAPKVTDFLRYFDPHHLDESLAYDTLVAWVAQIGPYADPPSVDPRLNAAIHHLGGWVQVCQTMPDPSDDFRVRRFRERFSGAWKSAQAAVIQGVSLPHRPLGLCSAPGQLRQIASSVEEAPAALGFEQP